MAKKSDKKTIIILLIVLGLVAVASGIWTYQALEPAALPEELEGDIKIDYVYDVKDLAIENIENFLDISSARGTLWEDLYSREQFQEMEDTEIDIDITKNVGNPNPFLNPNEDEGSEEIAR